MEYVRNMQKYTEKSEILKAIAHPVRLCIVRGLLEKECNVTRMQECLKIPQSTISQHLGKLKSARIIEGERCGLEINYRLVSDDVRKVVKALFN